MTAKYQVKITRSAERDFEEIWTYIANDSPDEADRFVQKIEKQIHALEHFPLRCPLAPENAVLGTSYRHLVYGCYRIIIKISGKSVFIMRLFHGSKLLDTSFF